MFQSPLVNLFKRKLISTWGIYFQKSREFPSPNYVILCCIILVHAVPNLLFAVIYNHISNMRSASELSHTGTSCQRIL